MARARKIAAVTARWAAGVVITLGLCVVLLLYTGPGHAVLGALVGWLSGGTVRVTDLGGALPNAPRARIVEIADKDGAWLRLEDVSVEWDAFAALGDHFAIRTISASKVAVLRRPIEEESTGEPTPRIDIDKLDLPRIEIAGPVAGHEAVLGASGSLHYVSRHSMSADLAVARLGGAGRYRVRAQIVDDVARGTVTIEEGADGILGSMLGVPGLGAINLRAVASGDDRANRIALDLSAGDLRAKGGGTISLARRSADVDFTAAAPAMQPNPDIKWQRLALDGHVHGGFDAPRVDGTLSLSGVAASRIAVSQLTARVRGAQGAVDLSGTAESLRIPGDHPDLFAQAPVAVAAHADLNADGRPVTFKVDHPLIALDGRAITQGQSKLTLAVTLPALEPFARLAGEDLHGRASFRIEAQQDDERRRTLSAEGRMDVQGTSVLARVLGRTATLSARATLHGTDIEQSQAAITGAALDFRSSGTLGAGHMDYGVTLKLPDVSKLAGQLIGSATLSGRILGPLDAAATNITGNATIASRGFEPRRIELTAQAKGFPSFSSGRLRASGTLNGAPVSIHTDLARKDDRLSATASMKWKSVDADGRFSFASKAPADGKARLDIGQLADLAPLLSLKLSGSLTSTVALAARKATVHAKLSHAEIDDAKLGAASVDGTIADPFGTPSLALEVAATQLSAAGQTGDAEARLTGPVDAMTISAKASLRDAQGTLEGRLDAKKKQLALGRFAATWRGETVTLAAPAAIDFANGIAVDRVVAKLGSGGEARLSGRLTPQLAASASLHAVDAKALEPFLSTPLDGVISAEAQLSGMLAEPRGFLTLQARNVVAREYFPRTPVGVDARGMLHGKSVTLDAEISAGPSAKLALKGEVPLDAQVPMKLHARGNADLALLGPFVAAEGRRIRGTLALEADVAGLASSPQVSGSGTIKDGELQDYARGVRLHAIDAAFTGDGEQLHIAKLSARAGPGTIGGTGTIDLGARGIPLNIDLRIDKARPISSDLMTATVSGNLHVSGTLKETLSVAGKLDVLRGTINVPDRFPPEVAVLDVRRKGKPAGPAPSGGSVALDVAISTSGPVFVRGRGIDADMGGSLRLGGTAARPVATGGLDMKRGTLSVAGQTLTFTSGRLGFDGAGIRNRIDPSLDLVAQASSGGVTATLTVTGHASAPKLVLSSTPALPQDEVLAHLLFQQSAKQLTPLQLAQIAQAIAALGGIGTGFDPLGAVRRGLHLDRLSVGSATGGASGSPAETTIEGGKYVARNIYVGAKQSLSGGAQVQVQIDLTKQLKAQATVSTGTNAAATKGSAAQDNGSSVGLSYEFEY